MGHKVFVDACGCPFQSQVFVPDAAGRLIDPDQLYEIFICLNSYYLGVTFQRGKVSPSNLPAQEAVA